METGLQAFRQPVVRGGRRSRGLHRLRLLRHDGLLRHHIRDARPEALHPLAPSLPVHRHCHLHRRRHGDLLLLRLVRGLAGSRLCGRLGEEDRVRHCFAWTVGHDYDIPPRKGFFFPSFFLSLAHHESLRYAEMLTFEKKLTDPRKIHLRPYLERHPAPELQQRRALGHMVRLRRRRDNDRLRDCERDPRVRRTGVSHRRAPGHPHVLPAYGLYVAVRQLEQGEPRAQREMVLDGRLLHLRHRVGNIPHGIRHLWIGCRYRGLV